MRRNILRRLSLMILLALGSASCGFTPVYAPTSKTATALSDVVVAPPRNNRANYIFVTELEDRIGRNLDAGKVLEHDVRVYEQGSGFETTTNRIQLIGNVTYQVISLNDGRLLFGGNVENFVSFVTNSNITTEVRNDATKRLMKTLADLMVNDLIAGFSRLADE